MRVAYIGNYRSAWSTENHVAESLEALGHEVRRLQESSVNWSAIPALLDGSARADLLLWTRTWQTLRAKGDPVLQTLRRMGIRSVSYHLDRWHGLDREHQLDDEAFFRTDLVVTADGTSEYEWRRRGINHVWMPPGVVESEALMEIAPNRNLFPHDVVFVGSYPYGHKEWWPIRQMLVESFRKKFGARFKVWPEVVRGRGFPIRSRRLNALYTSAKVVLGDSCLVPPVARYWSDRVPETLGRGGFLIHPWVEGIDEWYPDLPTFPVGDVDQAIALAEKWLEDDDGREALRVKQRALVLSRDTYRHRMQAVLDLLSGAG